MNRVPDVGVSQPCNGVDMFYILPNLLIGSYPSDHNTIGNTSDGGSLTKITKFLFETYGESLMINLVAEQTPYKIDEKYSSTVSCEWIHWIDHHPLALSDFVSLIYRTVKFLQDDTHVVFIHCKHGKGRTGTLVCALITLLYGVSLDEAFQIFVQRREIYNIGVKIESQLRLLRYWNDLLEISQVKLAYTQLNNNSSIWLIKKLRLQNLSGKKILKQFDLRIANINENSTEDELQFENLDKVGVNEDFICDYVAQENVCVELEYSKIISKSFVTFSINNAMESIYLENDGSISRQITINWDKMDGINGTGFKGKKYFDDVSIWIQQLKM